MRLTEHQAARTSSLGPVIATDDGNGKRVSWQGRTVPVEDGGQFHFCFGSHSGVFLKTTTMSGRWERSEVVIDRLDIQQVLLIFTDNPVEFVRTLEAATVRLREVAPPISLVRIPVVRSRQVA
jgi:hypothetical protein